MSADITLSEILSEDESFGSHWRDVDRIGKWLRMGLVTIERVELPTRGHDDMSDDEARHTEHTFSGRTFEHKRLCHQASLWLASGGTPWTARNGELDYEGGRADVAAVDGSIFIECGFTRAPKIEAAMLAGRAVMVVPYLADCHGPVCLGFIFRTTDRDALVVAYEEETHAAEKMRIALEAHSARKDQKP